MPVCLNCEVELPAGTETCPHCQQAVEEDVGGTPAFEEEPAPAPSRREDPGPKFVDEKLGGEALEDLPMEESAPADLPAAAPEPAAAGAGDADKEARRKAREARKADRGAGKPEAGKDKEAKPRAGRAGRGAAEGAPPKPARPAKAVTLSQNRKVVSLAALLWLGFALLYAGQFTLGLLHHETRENAHAAVFGVLGLASFLFLWAHLKMGRFISFFSAITAAGIEAYFFFGKNLENAPSFAALILLLLAQVWCLTGKGWFFRWLLAAVFGLSAAVLFCVPPAVDLLLGRVASAEQAMRALEKGEAMLSDGKPAKTSDVWPKRLEVSEAFDAVESELAGYGAALGVDLATIKLTEEWSLYDLVSKPRKRERILRDIVIPAVFEVLKHPQKGLGLAEYREAMKTRPAGEAPDEAMLAAWVEIEKRARALSAKHIARWFAAAPTKGAYYVNLKATLKFEDVPGSGVWLGWPLVREMDGKITPNRYTAIDRHWREEAGYKDTEGIERLWGGNLPADAAVKFDAITAKLEWDRAAAEMVFGANFMRRLVFMKAVVEVERVPDAAGGATPPAGGTTATDGGTPPPEGGTTAPDGGTPPPEGGGEPPPAPPPGGDPPPEPPPEPPPGGGRR